MIIAIPYFKRGAKMKERERINNRIVEISNWENKFFIEESDDVTKSYHMMRQKAFDQLGDQRQRRFLRKTDQVYVQIHSWLQQSRSYEDARHRMIQFAKTINPEVS